MNPVFKEAVRSILLNWEPIQFAIDQQTGGSQSREIAEKLQNG